MEQKLKSDEFIDLGANIRKIRIEKSMKQIEVVRSMQLLGFDVTKETMVKWEHGKKNFTASQLKTIQMILDTTLDELFKIKGDVK